MGTSLSPCPQFPADECPMLVEAHSTATRDMRAACQSAATLLPPRSRSFPSAFSSLGAHMRAGYQSAASLLTPRTRSYPSATGAGASGRGLHSSTFQPERRVSAQRKRCLLDMGCIGELFRG